jgi:hypothetical protein
MTVLVDAHVHIHSCFEVGRFLDFAATNFAEVRDDLGAKDDAYGCLMLTESAGVDRFAALAGGQPQTGSWRITPTAEAVSLLATRSGAVPMFLIAGRQIATAERLEVLALGTRASLPDGAPLRDTVIAVAKADALPVIPWGFGKWTGRRGRYLAELFAEPAEVRLYAGDNGGRPGVFRRPRLFAVAEGRGKFVLPGTDPLPFPGEIAKAGRYGFVADLDLDPARPFASLQRWLQRQRSSPPAFGRLERLRTFLSRQMWLHWRNRRRRG